MQDKRFGLLKGGPLSRLNSARIEDNEFVGKVLDIELVSPAWLGYRSDGIKSSELNLTLSIALEIITTAPSDCPLRHSLSVRLLLPPPQPVQPGDVGHVERMVGIGRGAVYRGGRVGQEKVGFVVVIDLFGERRRHGDGRMDGRGDRECDGRDGDEAEWGRQGAPTCVDGEEGESRAACAGYGFAFHHRWKSNADCSVGYSRTAPT
jgi:hypothetical protein